MKNQPKTKQKTKFKFEYLLAVILFVLVLVLFFTSFDFSNLNLGTEKASVSSISTQEKKVSEVLSKIDGVGKVNVLITTVNSSKDDYLTTTETVKENGIEKIVTSVVLVNGEPYKIDDKMNKINSIIVVCDGADNLAVKLAITEVLTTAFDVSSEKIRILKMK